MKRIRKNGLFAVLVLGLGVATFSMSSNAQPYGGPGPGYMSGGGYGSCCPYEGGGRGYGPRGMQYGMSDLKSRLQLNARQEKAWDNYVATLTANYQAMQNQEWTDLSGMSAPARLESVQKMRKERDGRMEKHLKAMKDLYATLTPEQQQIFDAEAGPMAGGYRGAGGGWQRGGMRSYGGPGYGRHRMMY